MMRLCIRVVILERWCSHRPLRANKGRVGTCRTRASGHRLETQRKSSEKSTLLVLIYVHGARVSGITVRIRLPLTSDSNEKANENQAKSQRSILVLIYVHCARVSGITVRIRLPLTKRKSQRKSSEKSTLLVLIYVHGARVSGILIVRLRFSIWIMEPRGSIIHKNARFEYEILTGRSRH